MGIDGVHTVKSFEHELDRLRGMMARMCGIVENQVSQAVSAVFDHNITAAQEAIDHDPMVDQLERDIEGLAIRLLALRSPMAGDLREIVSALKISSDLERIGDYAASIARRSTRVDLTDSLSLSGLRNMGRMVQENLRRSADAMTLQDPERAQEVWEADCEVDEYYTALFRELVTYMMEDPRNIGPCIHLLFIAKNLERIGDHTTNIAERVFYAVKGENLPPVRPRGKSSAADAIEQ